MRSKVTEGHVVLLFQIYFKNAFAIIFIYSLIIIIKLLLYSIINYDAG